ncbi:MAG: hypothetical protein J2P16_15915 [Mycobacterium sp.]|nr:hypothetical protein [Mycobacterium sp.]
MKLFHLGSLIAAGAIAAAATIVTAPAADAKDSESQIQSFCAAQNGTYDTFVGGGGDRISQCCYTTSGGMVPGAGPLKPHNECLTWVNGEQLNSVSGAGTGTTPPRQRPVSPPTAPVAPPVAVP